MRGEYGPRGLQTTALVNEAWIRLVDVRNVSWEDRAHFFGICANIMRRILVEAARAESRPARRRRAPGYLSRRTAGGCNGVAADRHRRCPERARRPGRAQGTSHRTSLFRRAECAGDSKGPGDFRAKRPSRLAAGGAPGCYARLGNAPNIVMKLPGWYPARQSLHHVRIAKP